MVVVVEEEKRESPTPGVFGCLKKQKNKAAAAWPQLLTARATLCHPLCAERELRRTHLASRFDGGKAEPCLLPR